VVSSCGRLLPPTLRYEAGLVMAGVTTSGVILSTFTLAADEDYTITILSEACADPKASLHEELMTNLFPRSATVLTVDQWIASLPAKG
jgi:nicotinamidase-related amidase